MSIFKMPSLGSDMEKATLIQWLIEPGASVKRGDVIAVVETEKGAIEIEVFENGTLGKYLAEIGSEISVGGPLAEIVGAQSEQVVVPAVAESEPVHPAEVTKAAPIAAPFAAPEVLPSVSTIGRRASPVARRLAAEHQIDLSALDGSGPDGAIVLADVQQALPDAQQEAVPVPTDARPAIDFDAMRRAIAAAMTRSKREIPHYYLKHTVDLERAAQWLTQANATLPPVDRILMGALFMKATALALTTFPEFNGFYTDDIFRPSQDIHLGTAIAIRGGGLVAPALHNAAQVPLVELMIRWRDLVTRVRAGRFRASEFSDPTVTVSSLGERGVEELFGVIYPPQVACIGFGKVIDQPWSMTDRTIATRATVTITLSADHRANDGHRGARFLTKIGELLQAPEQL